MALPPPPSSDPKAAAVMGYPTRHPPPMGNQPGKHTPGLPHRPPHLPRSHAARSNPQPPCRCRMPNDWKSEQRCIGVEEFLIVLTALAILCCILLARPEHPMLKVAGLTVSNLTVTGSTGATWKAALLLEKMGYFGDLSFSEVDCFLYYQWDAAQPLATASVEPFVLRSRTVIKVKITMEKSQAVIEDMDREWRSVGTLAIGLGLRMQGTYMLGSWWKRSYGHIEGYCDNLKIASVNSTGDGSLLTGHNSVAGDNLILSDNLPACSYKGDILGDTF
ncbi:hypothetical protein NL676_001908 [Syzygium grande]|nr:hypothetical protein NL676_001908 [Syzygium grande]